MPPPNPTFPTILYIYIVFVSNCVPSHLKCPSTYWLFLPSNSSQIKLKINQTNKRNFDKMSFTMKSKSLFLSLTLSFSIFSICLSVFFLLFLQPSRPGPLTYSGLFCFFVASLPHPSAPPIELGKDDHWIYPALLPKHTRIVSLGPWMLGILGEGDRTHCSRPADIHQIEVLLLLYYSL